jgi:predicted lipid-binding transport protein (Tim44 family)
LGTGLMAGLFGAGLLGMLMGNGFFGGLAGLASVFGLLLQIGLVVLLVSFAMKWFRNRQQQQPAYARSQGHPRSMQGGSGSVPPTGSSGLGGLGSGLAGLGGALGGAPRNASTAPPGSRDEVEIGDKDFGDFERALVDMQDAYSRSDIEKIWSMSTPEMAGYIQEELNDFAARGETNRVSDVKLLQGDLAEAWREGDTDYATVAMRYGLKDVTTEKATGRIVDGDPDEPVEARELWTFRRDGKGPWVLSAIQQS